MKPSKLLSIILATTLTGASVVKAQESKSPGSDELGELVRSYITKSLTPTELRLAIGNVIDDVFPSNEFVLEDDGKNNRMLLVDPLKPDAPSLEFYKRGVIKGNFTDSEHPQLLIIGSLRDPAEGGLTIDRSFVLLERILAEDGWNEPYASVRLNGFSEKTSSPLLCCKIEGRNDSDNDGYDELRISRYVRYVHDVTKGDAFYKETLYIIFYKGKPVLFGKIKSEKTEIKPEEVKDHILRENGEDTIQTTYATPISESERLAEENRIKEEKIRAFEGLHTRVAEFFQTTGIVSTKYVINEHGIIYTVPEKSKPLLADPLNQGQLNKIMNEVYGECHGTALCDDKDGTFRYKITACGESSGCP